MIEATSELVTLKKLSTLEEAQQAAGAEAANTGALSPRSRSSLSGKEIAR